MTPTITPAQRPGHGICWVPVPSGTCLFGDRSRPIKVRALEWTRTPITPAQLGAGVSTAPMTGLSQSEAAEIARGLGGRLPRSVEWEYAASGPGRRTYPWGEAAPAAHLANLRSGPGTTTEVGSHPGGATPEGLLDMVGNCWEWTSSSVLGDGFILRGGSYDSPDLYAKCTFLNAAPAELASAGIGFRVVRET
ncbi:formylglycine-generating enzyme family protein [Streptomyces zhihengii]|uniref:SUMF1/EgtB/PvdO family nonheme iron enzyme n=1 Tax=Streptomyces zhihengii TaxID=1818004 RepID=A0ABS2V5J1_9ACTN|nr:SUMF1/EgtB/PvdO family nonheme iron enzyme [Streptomyces zhihengii]MBM9624707.1 SUMF1/EgtB/PvdO family nonheme iron enzyme [Streptomyces zhihengii]